MMEENKMLEEFVELITLYKKLYNTGLVGLTTQVIQLDNKSFARLFNENIIVDNVDFGNITLKTTYNNITFITLVG